MMMASEVRLINTLRRYGLRGEKNKANLELWLNQTIEEIADNKGGHVVSASANGASFYQVANMTNAEWASCLDRAIQMIDEGIKSTGRSYGQIL